MKLRLLPLMAVLAFDYAILSLSLVIYAPLFLKGSHQFFMALPISHYDALVLTMVFYPLGQWFSASFWGAYSDYRGRKNVLVLTLLGSSLTLLLSAVSILYGQFILFLFSRLLTGLFAGNVAIAMAWAADLSSEQNRSSRFSLIQSGIGIGLLVGPILVLGFYHLSKWSFFVLPLLLLCVLGIVLAGIVYFIRYTKNVYDSSRWSISLIIKPISHLFDEAPIVRVLFLVWFLFISGWAIYQQFFPAYLTHALSFSAGSLSYIYIYLGALFAVFQLLLVRRINARFSPRLLLTISMFMVSLSFVILSFLKVKYGIYIMLAIYMLFFSTVIPNLMALISQVAKHQGKALGITSSLKALGSVVACVLVGVAGVSQFTFPLLGSSIVVFLSWMCCLYALRRLGK